MDYLTNQNIYRSNGKKPSFMSRTVPGLFFYLKMVSIIWHLSRLVKRESLTKAKWIESSIGIIRALESLGVQFEIENFDAFRNLNTPCVFVGNHMSTLETFIFPAIIQPYKENTFIVKQSLSKYPVFKNVLMTIDPIFVSRENPREDLATVLEEGVRRLKENISVVVFPQTTRTVAPTLQKFNTIGIKLAKRAGVPIVPFALRTDAWGNGRLIKDFGKIDPRKPVYIHFGDPILISGNGKKEHEQILQFITNKLNMWFRE
ncbi:1-acyl-sn-glycerol-3-phosphate acyltransferase [bacterium]|nr:1-acyl-sn-glycerol-3-phosphate acyltransferase [bacterium]RQV96313.1 MAG: 1-acyl-sn-glycerol-3-phosphate acyltransferase [bacterium]